MMYRTKRVAGWVACFFSLNLYSAIYQYHPSSPLHLAGGFDPLRPFELKLPCVSYDSIKNVDTGGATKTRFTLALVKSREDLYKQMQVSGSLSARYYFFSGGGGFELDDQSTFHADSLTWVVKAGSDYGRYLLQNPRLETTAASLIDRNEHTRFAERCGTEAVLEESRGAMIASVFTVENLSSENKRRLETSFKGGLDLGFFDLSMSASYKDFYQFATTMGKVHLDVFAIGGDGVTALKDLITAKPYDLDKIGRVLSDYTGSLTPEKSVPMEYLSASMQAFGWQGQSVATAYREAILASLFYNYRDAESIAKRLERILRDQQGDLSEEVIKKYRDQYREYLAGMGAYRDAAVKCERDVNDCKIPDLALSYVSWPKIKSDWDYCEAERMYAFRARLIDVGQLNLYRSRNLAPLYLTPGVRESGIDGWFACEVAAKENGFRSRNRDL